MKTKKHLIKKSFRRGLKPVLKVSVSNWADNFRILSAGISAEPGRWKTSRAPYQKAIMDAFTDSNIHRVVAKLASQTGKSDIMNNVIGRFAHLDPCTIMMVQPTVEMAEDFSKGRITPMIKDTKVLTKLFYELKDAGKTRNANQTILSKIFPGGRLIMCGANSPAGLASRPIRILLCDEVDRFPASAGQEGDPVSIAAKRTTTFWNYKIGLFSTPTVEDESRIDLEYMTGTQEEWQYQCPNCGEWHALDYRQMKSDFDEIKDAKGHRTFIVNSVKWQCPDCGFEFDEQKIKNAPQKYMAKNPDALQNGIRSFYVNAFSSPWLSWAEIMREWYESKGNPGLEQVVFNTRFGLSYRLQGAFSDENTFLKRRENYGAEIPDGVLILTAAVDVQDNRLEYEICGWGFGEECWGIQKGIIPGLPDQLSTWRELDRILDREYFSANGTKFKVARTFIDSGGHSTMAVYGYCRQNVYKQRWAVKGQGGAGLALIHKTVQAKKAPIVLTILGVNDGKQQTMNRLGIEKVGEQYFHFPVEDGVFDTPRGYDEVYFKGLISERKVYRKKGGTVYSEWEPVQSHVRNEPLDLRVYNLAAIKSCRVDWQRQAALVKGDAPMPKVNRRKKAKIGFVNAGANWSE